MSPFLIESIERGDQEPEQIELLDMPNQRTSVLEIEHEQGSYKVEEIEKDNSIDENEHKQVTFVRNSEDSKDSEETNVQEIKEEEKEFKASDDSNDPDDSDDSDDPVDQDNSNHCATIDSIKKGDKEPGDQQQELLHITNQRISVPETEHDQGSYKAEEIEKDNSNDEHEHVCTNCDDNALGSYGCNDCQDILCDECYKAHLKVKITRDHDLLTIQEFINQMSKSESE